MKEDRIHYEILDETHGYPAIFRQLSDILAREQEIVVDISHSFRHLPSLMMVDMIMENVRHSGKIRHILFAKELKPLRPDRRRKPRRQHQSPRLCLSIHGQTRRRPRRGMGIHLEPLSPEEYLYLLERNYFRADIVPLSFRSRNAVDVRCRDCNRNFQIDENFLKTLKSRGKEPVCALCRQKTQATLLLKQ